MYGHILVFNPVRNTNQRMTRAALSGEAIAWAGAAVVKSREASDGLAELEAGEYLRIVRTGRMMTWYEFLTTSEVVSRYCVLSWGYYDEYVAGNRMNRAAGRPDPELTVYPQNALPREGPEYQIRPDSVELAIAFALLDDRDLRGEAYGASGP